MIVFNFYHILLYRCIQRAFRALSFLPTAMHSVVCILNPSTSAGTSTYIVSAVPVWVLTLKYLVLSVNLFDIPESEQESRYL